MMAVVSDAQHQQQAPPAAAPLTLRSLLGDDDMDMLRDCFIALDHDGDGRINPHVIGAVVLEALGEERYVGYEPYLLRIFEAADKDGDGFLNLIEFIECYAEGPGIVPQDVVARCVSGVKIRMTDDEVNVLQKVFFAMDSDGDGLVGGSDLEEALANALLGPAVPVASPPQADNGSTTHRRLIRKRYAHLTPADISAAAHAIIAAADRDGDGKINVSDFILSFQYDQKVIPLELLEARPAISGINFNGSDSVAAVGGGGSGGLLTAEELVAVRNTVLPFLILEDDRRTALQQQQEEEAAAVVGNVSVMVCGAAEGAAATVANARPPSPLQAPYGRLFTLLRSALGHALGEYFSLEDVDAIADLIIAEGEEVLVHTAAVGEEEASSSEINIVNVLLRIVQSAEQSQYFQALLVAEQQQQQQQQQHEGGATEQHQHPPAEAQSEGQQQQQKATISASSAPAAVEVDLSMLLSPTRHMGSPPTAAAATGEAETATEAAVATASAVGQSIAASSETAAPSARLISNLQRPPSATAAAAAHGNKNAKELSSADEPPQPTPYPSNAVSARNPSVTACAVSGSRAASRPTSAIANKAYQQPPPNVLSAKAAASSADNGGARYAAYVHPTITTLEATDAAAAAIAIPAAPANKHSYNRRLSTQGTATPPPQQQKLLDPDALKKVFVSLATNIIMTTNEGGKGATTTAAEEKKTEEEKKDETKPDGTVVVEGPSAFVQRLRYTDAAPHTRRYLADVFPQWTNEQVAVAAETLWSKAVSAGGTLASVRAIEADLRQRRRDAQPRRWDKVKGDGNNNSDDDDGDDGEEGSDMGFLTLDAFIHSFRVGGELTAVMADCTTFTVVNIGALPLSVANQIARGLPVPMNCIQRSVVRGAILALLRAVNNRRLTERGHTLEGLLFANEERRRQKALGQTLLKEEEEGGEEKASDEDADAHNYADPAARYCTTDVAIDDLRFALATALEPFIAFDMDPSTAEFYEDKEEEIADGGNERQNHHLTVAAEGASNGDSGHEQQQKPRRPSVLESFQNSVDEKEGKKKRKPRRVVTLIDKITRLARSSETVFDSSPSNATESRLCVNIAAVASELGIRLPETMTAILAGGAACDDEDYDEYDLHGNKITTTNNNGVGKGSPAGNTAATIDGVLVLGGGATASSQRNGNGGFGSDNGDDNAPPPPAASVTPFELALIGAMLQRIAPRDSVAVAELEEMLVDIFIPPHLRRLMTENPHSAEQLHAAKNKIKAVRRALIAFAGERRAAPTTAGGVAIPKHLRADYDPMAAGKKPSEYEDVNDGETEDTRPTRVKVATLGAQFEASPSAVMLAPHVKKAISQKKSSSATAWGGVGVELSLNGVGPAIDGLAGCGLDAADLRALTELLITADRAKDGAMPLVQTYKSIRRLVERTHPTWDTHQVDRPAALVLNTAVLLTSSFSSSSPSSSSPPDGRLSLTPLIRACAAEFYLTPEKHAQPHSGALSRRLDTADLAKVRRAIETVSGGLPIDEQHKAMRAAIVDAAIVGDSASLNGMVETIMACLRQQKLTPEALAERLLEKASLLTFPIMLARDCQDVCLRKLRLSVPPEVLQTVVRTLLLLDTKGDGLLRRDAVEDRLTHALTERFGETADAEAASSAGARASAAKAIGGNGAPVAMITAGPTASSPTSTNISSGGRNSIVLPREKINEIVRLIILSQFEQVAPSRFARPTSSGGHHGTGQSTTGANRVLEVGGFIDLLVNTVDGAVLPRAVLPDVEVPFKSPLGFDELEILKGALESIAQDKRTAMTAVDLANLLESAMQDRRRPFVKVIGDVMLKLADGPENSRFDLTLVCSHFTISQKVLTFHTAALPLAAADRVAGRVVRRDKIRRLARVFTAIDTNRDGKLSKDELWPHLLADAHRTVTDHGIARGMAGARWAEIEALAARHERLLALEGGGSTNNNTAAAAAAISEAVARRTAREVTAANTLVSLETFLSTFALGRFPALSELEMDMVIKRAVSAAELAALDGNNGMGTGKYSISSAASPLIASAGGAAHRLRISNSGHGGSSPSPASGGSGGYGSGTNAAGDYDNSGLALPYEGEEGSNNNRARYLSARNLSDVPIFDDELQQEFNFYDAEGRGVLDQQTFKRQYRMEMEHYGVRPSAEAVDEAFRLICSDSKKVSFEEFCMLMLRRSKM